MTQWQPIETAPKDRTIILFRPTASEPIRIASGWYNYDKYAENPRPYWAIALSRFDNVTDSRYYEPTHWCDFPSEPITTP